MRTYRVESRGIDSDGVPTQWTQAPGRYRTYDAADEECLRIERRNEDRGIRCACRVVDEQGNEVRS